MKKWSLVLFILSSLNLRGQETHVLHYHFFLEVNDQNDTVRGLASVSFVQLTDNRKVVLDLSSMSESGLGMKVDYTALFFSDPLLQFQQKDQKLFVTLPSARKDTAQTLHISYKGIPTDGLIISKNKYGDRTFFADNWPNRAHHWLPCIDRPDDKASFEFIVHAPSHYSVISNGIKVEERAEGEGMKMTHWREDILSPTKVMVIGVAKFATKVFDDSPKDVPVSAWVYPQDSAKGFYDYAVTPSILKFFADYIEPYPYKKLANVQSKTIFGGMENASCIFYAESSVTGDRSNEDLMAHEIAHQWFGDMVSEKSFAHLWLSEGFATYFTNFYFEKKYGQEAAAKRWQKEREEAIAFSKTTTHPVVDSTTDLMSLLNANSYQKGAWVLRMLRQEVGDTSFQKIIREYYNAFKSGNADTKDFEAVAEKVSGKELSWFFDQWLYLPGLPRLMVKKQKTGKKIKIKIVQMGKVYKLPLTVFFFSSGAHTTKETLLLKDRETELSWNGGDVDIRLDFRGELLFEEVKN